MEHNKDYNKDYKNKESKLMWQKNHALTNINKPNDNSNHNNNTFSNINKTSDQSNRNNTIEGTARNDRAEFKITSPNTKFANKTYVYQPKFNLQDVKRAS